MSEVKRSLLLGSIDGFAGALIFFLLGETVMAISDQSLAVCIAVLPFIGSTLSLLLFIFLSQKVNSHIGYYFWASFIGFLFSLLLILLFYLQIIPMFFGSRGVGDGDGLLLVLAYSAFCVLTGISKGITILLLLLNRKNKRSIK